MAAWPHPHLVAPSGSRSAWIAAAVLWLMLYPLSSGPVHYGIARFPPPGPVTAALFLLYYPLGVLANSGSWPGKRLSAFVEYCWLSGAADRDASL